MNVESWVEKRTILKVYRGSYAYGLNHEDSDVDLGAVCIPPKDFLIGCYNFEHYTNKNYINYPQYEQLKKVAEITIYGLQKFVKLAVNCNPNIIEHLFVDPSDIIYCDDLGAELIQNRHLFLSAKARFTFGGYALSQLNKLVRKDKSNHNSHGSHKYLIEEYGYDTKHAEHLIRLLHMGIEVLTEGNVYVKRPDREYLLSIRYGKYTLDYIKKEADGLFKRLEDVCMETKLPESPNIEKINRLLIDITLKWFERWK